MRIVPPLGEVEDSPAALGQVSEPVVFDGFILTGDKGAFKGRPVVGIEVSQAD